MLDKKLLIVSGTHGNELNPVMAVNKFRNLTLAGNNNYFEFILGNPLAYEKGLRYLDIDLNRSFDFKVASTQQLVLSVIIPEKSSENKDIEGCLSALIGFKL